jgi:hypothetical protein
MIAVRAALPYDNLPANEKQHIKRCHDWVDHCVFQAIQEYKSGKVPGDGEKGSFLQKLVQKSNDRLDSGELIALLIAIRGYHGIENEFSVVCGQETGRSGETAS